MTSTVYFDSLQASTINNIYEDVENWWNFFYILSDAVEEIDPVAADGMRWLCEIRQRPIGWMENRNHRLREKRMIVHWWGHHTPVMHDNWQNYLPKIEFEIIASNIASVRIFNSPSESLSAFLIRWVELDAATRSRLWREWAGKSGS